MKKKLFMAFMLILSSAVFIGCSNTTTSAAKTANKTHQKGRNAIAKIQKNTKFLNFLGITKKDFNSERKAGKSIVDIAKEKNKTEQQVINFLVNQQEATFKKKNPNISGAKLNQKIQQWTKKITAQVEKKPKNKKGA